MIIHTSINHQLCVLVKLWYSDGMKEELLLNSRFTMSLFAQCFFANTITNVVCMRNNRCGLATTQ